MAIGIDRGVLTAECRFDVPLDHASEREELAALHPAC
jgi:hypothetical protein